MFRIVSKNFFLTTLLKSQKQDSWRELYTLKKKQRRKPQIQQNTVIVFIKF